MITLPVGGAERVASAKYIGGLLLFAIATIVSAATLGSVCSLLGSLLINHMPMLRIIVWSLITAVGIAYGFAESAGVQWWVPQRHWQVPQTWGWYGRLFYAAAFGLVLGSGFFTFIPFVGYHLLLALCFVAADPLHGGILLAVFGGVRAFPVLFGPLISWLRWRSWTAEMTMKTYLGVVSIDRKLGTLRVAILFAIAGSTLAVALGSR